MQLSRLQLQLRQMQSPIRTGAVWRGWDQCREWRRCAEFPIVSIVLSFWEKCFAASRFAPLLAGRLRRLPCTWIKTSAFYMLTVNVFGSFRMQCLMHPLRATLHCRALCHQCATWNQKQNTSQHYSTKRRQAQCNKRTFLTSNHQDSPRHQWHPKHQYQETYTTSGSDRPDRPDRPDRCTDRINLHDVTQWQIYTKFINLALFVYCKSGQKTYESIPPN